MTDPDKRGARGVGVGVGWGEKTDSICCSCWSKRNVIHSS